jgi:hypothetical protein
MDEPMTYEELYQQLCKAEQHIVYLEQCIRAASTGMLPENADVRQQMLAITYHQLKNGLHKIIERNQSDSEKGYVL